MPPHSWQDPARHIEPLLEHPWYRLVARLLDAVAWATSTFWRDRGLLWAQLSITTGSVSSPMGLGSDSRPVQVVIGSESTYLADSQQFALELMCRLHGMGAWYLMPSFRAELNDERHLGQFVHSEAEVPGDLTTIMTLVDDYVRHLAAFLHEEMGQHIADVTGDLEHLASVASATSVPRMTTSELADELLPYEHSFVADPAGRFRTLTSYGERLALARFGPILWVTAPDEFAVPFYQAVEVNPEGRRVARSADLLMGVGETVGAGERHMTPDELSRALARHEVPGESYEWYVEMRRRRTMRTAGFGMGVERFLLWVLRHDDVRDLQLLLRGYGAVGVP